jgi:hypothetical protein
MRPDFDHGYDCSNEPEEFAADGNHGLVLGFTPNQQMTIAFVSSL